jgi:plasmid stabilization system protein ParE
MQPPSARATQKRASAGLRPIRPHCGRTDERGVRSRKDPEHPGQFCTPVDGQLWKPVDIAAENPQKAGEQILSVRKAFELLADHPLLGRPAEEGRRELILSRGRYGYIAKYRGLPAEDIVLILAVRHQLEAGYAGE